MGRRVAWDGLGKELASDGCRLQLNTVNETWSKKPLDFSGQSIGLFNEQARGVDGRSVEMSLTRLRRLK